LLESPATNVEFSATSETKIRFENMSGSWPVMWSLHSVRLYHSADKKHEVNITTQELRELRKQPFVMNWMATRSPKN